jgi:hypothetical protein
MKLLVFLGVLGLTLLSTFIELELYNWFLLEITNYPLEFFHLMGIVLIVGLITRAYIHEDKGVDEWTALSILLSQSCYYLIVWGLGAIIQFWLR